VEVSTIVEWFTTSEAARSSQYSRPTNFLENCPVILMVQCSFEVENWSTDSGLAVANAQQVTLQSVHSAWKCRPRNDLYSVGWDVKPYSLSHCIPGTPTHWENGRLGVRLSVPVHGCVRARRLTMLC